MSSLRKRYQGRLESRSDDGPPVASAPTVAAKMPPAAVVAAEPLKIEQPELPAEQAAKNAIQQRLEESQRAEALQRQPAEHPNFATEPQDDPAEQMIARSNLPPRMQHWLRQHPDWVTDATKNARMQKMHHVAEWQAGQAFTDDYINKMESLLGLAPAEPVTVAAPRAAPARQQYVSAPVHRDTPSFVTGRPQSSPMQLTAEELELARTLGISSQQYIEGKKRMLSEKAGGLHADGR